MIKVPWIGASKSSEAWILSRRIEEADTRGAYVSRWLELSSDSMAEEKYGEEHYFVFEWNLEAGEVAILFVFRSRG